MASRFTWGGIALTVICAAILAYQVLLPPVIGMGDNGDFQRLICFGWLTPDADPRTPYDEKAGFVQLGYKVDVARAYPIFHPPAEGVDLRYISSQILVLKAALAINGLLAKTPDFDVRFMGAIHVVLFLLAFALMVWATGALPPLERWVARIAAAAIFTDVGYIAYFNTFYAEPGTYVFLALLVAVSLVVILLKPQPRAARWWLLALFVLSVLFVTSKAQNVFLGFPLAGLLYVMARVYLPQQPLLPVLNLRIMPAALLIVCTFAYFAKGRSVEVSQCNLYHVVFLEMTNPAHSPDPKADLRALGLDADKFVVLAGTDWYTPGVPRYEGWFQREFFGKVSYAKIAKFYLTRPGRTAALIGRHAKAAFLLRPPQYGNFPREAGYPMGEVSRAFSAWSRAKAFIVAGAPEVGTPTSGIRGAQPGDWWRIPAAPLFVGFVIVNLVALGLKLAGSDREPWQRMISVLHLGLLGMLVMEFFMVVLGDAGYEDTMIKHMYMANQLMDLCTIFLLAEIAAGARALYRQWRGSRPAFRAVTEEAQYTAETV